MINQSKHVLLRDRCKTSILWTDKHKERNQQNIKMASGDEDFNNIASNVDEEEERNALLSDGLYDESSQDSSSGGEDGGDELLAKFKAKRKRRGRRSTFPDAIIDDMVDIITSNDVCKRKLLYENTKKKAN